MKFESERNPVSAPEPTTNTSYFVITKQGSPELNTSVLSIGDSEEEAALIFTDSARAMIYLNQAGWMETETVAELKTAEFVRWLDQLRKDGVELLVPDPERIHQEDGIRQSVVTIASIRNAIDAAVRERLLTVQPAS